MSAETLGSKVRTSIMALQGRQAIMLAMNLGVGIVLARKLDPAVFGLYAIATFCLSLVTMATDFGLAGSLIQRRDKLGHHEISVAFTIQTLVAIGASTLIWFLAPLSLLVYHSAPPELAWVIRSMIPLVLLSPIVTTAKVQLERDLQFHKIAGIDITSMVVVNITTLTLVFMGWGVWSFIAANVLGSIVGTGLSWTMISQRPSVRFDKKLARELFSFGVFFQFGNITNEAAGWVIPLISGMSLGPAAVGLLTWASSNGRRPLMIVENVMRVAFPHFSRLQDDREELARQLDLYLKRLLGLSYFWAAMAILLAKPMTVIVYTAKWLPGATCLQMFALALALDIVNWVCGMSLTAIGGVRITARWTLVKSVLAIGGSFALVRIMGMEGIPLASAIASAVSGAGIIFELRRRVPMKIVRHVMLMTPFAAIAASHLAVERFLPEFASVSGWSLGIALGVGYAYYSWRDLWGSKGGSSA